MSEDVAIELVEYLYALVIDAGGTVEISAATIETARAARSMAITEDDDGNVTLRVTDREEMH